MNLGNALRQLSPLVILGIAAVALLAPVLPGAAWVAEHFGANFVLGFCVCILSLYVLLLWGETIRLHGMLTAVLKALQDFKAGKPAEAKAEDQRRHRLEAVRLLIPALTSADAKVRESSHDNLVRLIGKDLGKTPAAWQSWLASQEGAPAAAAETRPRTGEMDR
jgi:hypothetical protein